MGVRITRYRLSYMPESETHGRQPALRPHVLRGCRMYRMCRQPRCHSPARLSPQCWAASWHPVTRRPSYFSTLPMLPTLLKLSMHFVFHLLPAPGLHCGYPGFFCMAESRKGIVQGQGKLWAAPRWDSTTPPVKGRYQAQYRELFAYTVGQE